MRRGGIACKAFWLSFGLAVAGTNLLSAPSFAQPALLVVGTGASHGSGVIVGGQVGYDWQTGPAVFGLATDLSATSLSSSAIGTFQCAVFPCAAFSPLSASASSSIDWYGTVRGRAGFATGPLLLYATGGLAFGEVNLASRFTAHDPGSILDFAQNTQTSALKTGWVLGGGIEYRLQDATIALGYQYVDLGAVSQATLPPASPGEFLTQSASAHARFQAVTLALSLKFASSDTMLRPWQGGYLGGHFGGTWGDFVNANFFGFFVSCFTAETQVVMADGTSRPIVAVEIGDEVLGEDGEINRVVAIETPPLGTRKLYSFNGGPAFVTPEHPFMTHTGWKSIAPDATYAENNNFSAGKLEVGDELVALKTITTRARAMSVALGERQAPSVKVLLTTKFSPLNQIESHDGDPSMTLYNLRLDGNHTYFANNYLVHNK